MTLSDTLNAIRRTEELMVTLPRCASFGCTRWAWNLNGSPLSVMCFTCHGRSLAAQS
jgi:hypothetical protein